MNRRLQTVLLVAALAAAASCPVRPAVLLEEEETVFRLSAPGASRVFVVGDFNGWNATLDRMAETEGVFEIRLYLVAGRYRYRFVVDGESIPDPDNPHRDEDGRSLFVLREKEGGLEILFEEPAARESAGAPSSASLGGALSIDAVPNDSRAYLMGRAAGTIEGNIEMDAAVGLRYGAVQREYSPGFSIHKTGFKSSDSAPGAAYLLRAKASYIFDRGRIVAFSRTNDLGLERPFSLLGTVGPFRYPVLLFSRGLAAEMKLPFDLSAQAIYASRIDGYESEWDHVYQSQSFVSLSSLSSSRIDSDIFGFEVGRSGRLSDVRYMFRYDKRCETPWPKLDPQSFGDVRGHEEVAIHGARIQLGDTNRVHASVEGAIGGRDIVVTHQHADCPCRVGGPCEPCGERIAPVWEWEHGYRVKTAAEARLKDLTIRAEYARATIEGERSLRWGKPDGIQDIASLGLKSERWGLDFSLDGKMEWYSDQNTGSTFWLATNNFWLDGPEVTPTLIPFLSAQEIAEMRLAIGEHGSGAAFAPYDNRLRLRALCRFEPGNSGRLVSEMSASKGIHLLRGISIFGDARYVDYRYNVQSWLHTRQIGGSVALKWEYRERAWCALGWGAPQYRFDRWTYRFEDHGWEDYLIEHGGMSSGAVNNEAYAVWKLLWAEYDLSNVNWITFEAGFEF